VAVEDKDRPVVASQRRELGMGHLDTHRDRWRLEPKKLALLVARASDDGQSAERFAVLDGPTRVGEREAGEAEPGAILVVHRSRIATARTAVNSSRSEHGTTRVG
jgi:hypothetical protein